MPSSISNKFMLGKLGNHDKLGVMEHDSEVCELHFETLMVFKYEANDIVASISTDSQT